MCRSAPHRYESESRHKTPRAFSYLQEEGCLSIDVDHPLSVIAQPIPPPQKATDEIEPPSTPKRKVSFAPDAFSFEEAIKQKDDQGVLHGDPASRSPSQYFAQRIPVDGSYSIGETVERILRARIRGPLMVMVALLLLVVLLLVAISGILVYVLLGLRNEMIHRKESNPEVSF